MHSWVCCFSPCAYMFNVCVTCNSLPSVEQCLNPSPEWRSLRHGADETSASWNWSRFLPVKRGNGTHFCLPVTWIFMCVYLTYVCDVSSFRIYSYLSVLSLITCFQSLNFAYIVSLGIELLGFLSAKGKYFWEISKGLLWVQERWIKCLKTVCRVFQSYVVSVGLHE